MAALCDHHVRLFLEPVSLPLLIITDIANYGTAVMQHHASVPGPLFASRRAGTSPWRGTLMVMTPPLLMR